MIGIRRKGKKTNTAKKVTTTYNGRTRVKLSDKFSAVTNGKEYDLFCNKEKIASGLSTIVPYVGTSFLMMREVDILDKDGFETGEKELRYYILDWDNTRNCPSVKHVTEDELLSQK